MTNPRLLILDEATEGLAPAIADRLWDIFGVLRVRDQALLIVDRNLDALAKIAGRFAVMDKGRIVWMGDTVRMHGARAHIEGYLGIKANAGA
jgi:branched-chain amino acid transport system ATP-binding protein